MTDIKQLVTPKFRVAFPHLFEMETFKQGKPKYSVTMLFPKDTDMSELKAAAKAAADEKWPDKKPRGFTSPFKDGDARENDEESPNYGELKFPYEGYEGHYVVKASTTYDKHGIVDLKKNPITDEEKVYAGCYGRAYIRAGAYDKDVSKGVTFYLIHFQKLAEGDPLVSSITVQDAFNDDVSEQSETDKAFGDSTEPDFGV